MAEKVAHHKRNGIIIAVVIIVLLLGVVSYFGVLSPDRFLGSRDYASSYTQSSLTIEVNHGNFDDSLSKLRETISTAGAKIYRESVNEYNGKKSASFTIDVLDQNSDILVTKLKEVGDVVSYSHSKGATTRSYGTDGLLTGYTRITVSLREKESVFASFRNLKATNLGRTFGGSIVALFYFIIAVLPWVLVILGIYFLVKFLNKK